MLTVTKLFLCSFFPCRDSLPLYLRLEKKIKLHNQHKGLLALMKKGTANSSFFQHSTSTHSVAINIDFFLRTPHSLLWNNESCSHHPRETAGDILRKRHTRVTHTVRTLLELCYN